MKNLKHGNGKIIYPDGLVHEGEFEDGKKKDGYATLTDANGT